MQIYDKKTQILNFGIFAHSRNAICPLDAPTKKKKKKKEKEKRGKNRNSDAATDSLCGETEYKNGKIGELYCLDSGR